MLEQGGPSEKVPVVDLSSSSDEECLISDTLRNDEFTKRLFGDLNCDVLGPPGDARSSSSEEVREEDAADTETVPSSAMTSPAPTASTDDVDKGDTPNRVIGGNNSGEDEAGLP
jgi:hypothetical protein